MLTPSQMKRNHIAAYKVYHYLEQQRLIITLNSRGSLKTTLCSGPCLGLPGKNCVTVVTALHSSHTWPPSSVFLSNKGLYRTQSSMKLSGKKNAIFVPNVSSITHPLAALMSYTKNMDMEDLTMHIEKKKKFLTRKQRSSVKNREVA